MSFITAIGSTDLATPLEVAQRFANATKSVTADSLIEYSAPARLSPIVVIDQSAINVDPVMTRAVLQTMLSIYTSCYLTAISMDMNIGNINVHRLLDKFATDRDLIRAAGSSDYFTMQGADHIIKESDDSLGYISMEAIDYTKGALPRDWSKRATAPVTMDALTRNGFSMEAAIGTDDEPLVGAGNTSRDTRKELIEDSNLAVGKLIEVPLQAGENSVTMMVAAQILPSVMPSNQIIDITRYNSLDKSFTGRWHQMRAGEIRAVKDWIMNLDLIEADRKALLADKTGTLLAVRSRRAKNIFAALVSGRASPNAISSMMVVTKQTAIQMETMLKGKLDNPRVLKRFWETNVLMMLVVIDTDMERLTIYMRGVVSPSDHTFDDIKGNAKNPNGVDMDSVLKAYKLGNSITL